MISGQEKTGGMLQVLNRAPFLDIAGLILRLIAGCDRDDRIKKVSLAKRKRLPSENASPNEESLRSAAAFWPGGEEENNNRRAGNKSQN